MNSSQSKGLMLFITSTLILTIVSKAVQYTTSNNRINRIIKYIPFDNNNIPNCIIVDCTHSYNKQITHHLKNKNQRTLSLDLTLQGDSTTDTVLNIIKHSYSKIYNDDFDYVTSNHFDIDSFLSSWCIINPLVALRYEDILRNIANIGDFRELSLLEEHQHKSLKVACWLNSEEKRLFYRPFESAITSKRGEEEGVDKFEHFLPLLEKVLENPLLFEEQWIDEYTQVVKEYNDIHNNNVYNVYDDIGLVSVHCKNPGHYYSLFSTSKGCDVVVSIYQDNRYEVEIKYTTFIDLQSRPTFPRVELEPLCNYLNNHDSSCNDNFKWTFNRITDSGPLLRIDNNEQHLSKAERYGHPCERPYYQSSISPDKFESIVLSYFKYAYSNINRKKDWTWRELQEFNRNIDWTKWQSPV